ncbi:hypothetical protein BX667DRAFT_497804 [Coemansia mojavensis]|nr:hypothetical protein BX667DRAFT_497804 [Coemansia mojavensis]
MVCIVNLPWDIQILVLKAVVGKSGPALELWKHQLPVLSVCRLWRLLALPMTYNSAFISSNAYVEHTRPQSLALNHNRGIATNVDLIKSNRALCLARKLDIELVHTMGLEEFLKQVQQLLYSYEDSKRWENVRTLNIRLYVSSVESGVQNLDEPDPVLLYFSDAISSYLPNLKKLVFYGEPDSQPAAEFIGNLLAKYKLSEIWCNSPIKYSCSQFSTELTSLKLMFDPHGDQLLSRINASSLKYLNLYGISGEFSWHKFGQSAAGLPNKVVFSSLQKLEVAYGHMLFDEGGDTVIDRNRCYELELHFPVLSNLRILHCPSNCVLLTAGRFPKSLGQATIHGSSCIIPLLSKCKLNQVRQIAVNIHYTDYYDSMELSKSANYVFGNSRYIQNASLYLGRQAKLSSFSVNTIYWPNVTRALIMSPLAVGILLELLNRLPNLLSLVSYRTSMDQIANVCAANSSARNGKTEFKLERLGIIYIVQECHEHDLETLMAYLLPRMQALTFLNVPSQHIDIFQTIVDQHGANITIKGFI